jgi:hypothetical protein
LEPPFPTWDKIAHSTNQPMLTQSIARARWRLAGWFQLMAPTMMPAIPAVKKLAMYSHVNVLVVQPRRMVTGAGVPHAVLGALLAPALGAVKVGRVAPGGGAAEVVAEPVVAAAVVVRAAPPPAPPPAAAATRNGSMACMPALATFSVQLRPSQ